jgi:hypothetical protein
VRYGEGGGGGVGWAAWRRVLRCRFVAVREWLDVWLLMLVGGECGSFDEEDGCVCRLKSSLFW